MLPDMSMVAKKQLFYLKTKKTNGSVGMSVAAKKQLFSLKIKKQRKYGSVYGSKKMTPLPKNPLLL